MNMKRFYYLLSLIVVFVIPASIEAIFVYHRIRVRHLIYFVILITILGSVWDLWATKHGKKDKIWLWQFNYSDTLGIKLFDLPIEEYLFYITSSLYIIFVWEGIKLALDTNNVYMYLIIPLLGLWSLFGSIIPMIKKSAS